MQLSPKILALGVGLLLWTGCRKAPEPVPAPESGSVATTLDTTSPLSGAAPPPTATAEPTPVVVPDSVPEVAKEAVRLVDERVAILKARWTATMTDTTPLPKFKGRSWEEALPTGSNRRKPLLRRFMKIEECGGDSVFDVYFQNGDASYGGLESEEFVLARGLAMTGGLQLGMQVTEVHKLLGNPYRSLGGIESFAYQDWGEREYSQRIAWRESVRLFFTPDGVLEAIWVVTPFYDC